MNTTKCAICGKSGGKRNLFTVRESWIQAGGFGSIPEDARVHISCDKREQAKIKTGKIKLSDLWVRVNPL